MFESQTYNKIHSSSSNRTAPTKNLLVERKKRKKEEDRGGRVAVAKKEFGVMCQPNLRGERERKGTRMGWDGGTRTPNCRPDPPTVCCRRKERKRTDAALKVEGRIFPSSSHSKSPRLAGTYFGKLREVKKLQRSRLPFRHSDKFLLPPHISPS